MNDQKLNVGSDKSDYHMSNCGGPVANSRECTGVNGKALQVHTVDKKRTCFTVSLVKIRIRYLNVQGN